MKMTSFNNLPIFIFLQVHSTIIYIVLNQSDIRSIVIQFQANKSLPLYGVPIIVKDNIDTTDFFTRNATPGLKE